MADMKKEPVKAERTTARVWRNKRIHVAVADTIFNATPGSASYAKLDAWLRQRGKVRGGPPSHRPSLW
jgi:hypothetical protein